MNKILSPQQWQQKNKFKYPNATVISVLMKDYAEYYYNQKTILKETKETISYFEDHNVYDLKTIQNRSIKNQNEDE
jgi:hypothetical protein